MLCKFCVPFSQLTMQMNVITKKIAVLIDEKRKF